MTEERRGTLVTGNGDGGLSARLLRWLSVKAKEGTRMGNEGAGLEQAVLGC